MCRHKIFKEEMDYRKSSFTTAGGPMIVRDKAIKAEIVDGKWVNY